MKKTIILLTDYPFNKRDYERFGIDTLQNFFDVEVWDVSSLIYPNFTEDYFTYADLPPLKITQFISSDAFINSISAIEGPVIMIIAFDLSEKTFFFYHQASRKKIPFCTLQMVTFPHPETGQIACPSTRILQKLRGLDIREYCHYLFMILQMMNNRAIYKLTGINSPAYVILTGEVSENAKKIPFDPEKTKKIWAHTLDYDLYLNLQNQKSQCNKPYIVFLDEDFAGHIEFTMFNNYKSPFTPEEYYSIMTTFFDYLEKELGLPIIIAAHPRTKNLNDMRIGYKREVIQGKTAQLVKDSSLVLTHVSTALNFAILFKKPIMFLTTDKLEKRTTGIENEGAYLLAVAKTLNQIPVNADHPSTFIPEMVFSFDEAAYLHYKREYLKKDGTPEKPFWEIVSEFIAG